MRWRRNEINKIDKNYGNERCVTKQIKIEYQQI